jgi:hypothetical protein
MVFSTVRSNRQSQWPDCFKTSDGWSGAHQLFDEMPNSRFEDWRPPNRILEVTVHKVFYPITESLLHQVFGTFGVVEQVLVFGGTNKVLARVVFESKHVVAEAFGELHGRCVYTGCCQLDIKWGLYQDYDNANSDVSCFGTTVKLSSTIAMDHIPDTSTAVAAATATNAVPGCIDVKLPDTCLTLGLDVAAHGNCVCGLQLREAIC